MSPLSAATAWNDMAVGRSILLVAQLAPPSELSAARRVAGLAKYLDRLGHRVTVLTSLAGGRGPVPGARVVRTRDAMVSTLNWRRESFAALAGGSDDRGYEARPSRLASLFVPDLAVAGWLPFVLQRMRALAVDVDAVVTTSPPHSGHLVGLAPGGTRGAWPTPGVRLARCCGRSRPTRTSATASSSSLPGRCRPRSAS